MPHPPCCRVTNSSAVSSIHDNALTNISSEEIAFLSSKVCILSLRSISHLFPSLRNSSTKAPLSSSVPKVITKPPDFAPVVTTFPSKLKAEPASTAATRTTLPADSFASYTTLPPSCLPFDIFSPSNSSPTASPSTASTSIYSTLRPSTI